MADYPLVEGQLQEPAGLVTASTMPTLVLAGDPANTKGDFVELIAATSIDAVAMLVWSMYISAASFGSLVDIAVGANPDEEVVVPDLYVLSTVRSPGLSGPLVPVAVPAGSRLSARTQSDNVGYRNVYVGVALLAQGFLPGQQLSRMSALGVDAANSRGTAVTAAGAHTKGSWAELSAATPHAGQHLLIAGGCADSPRRFLTDIAVGANPDEEAIITDVYNAYGTTPSLPLCLSLPMQIPAGSRVTARCQSATVGAVQYVAAYIIG